MSANLENLGFRRMPPSKDLDKEEKRDCFYLYPEIKATLAYDSKGYRWGLNRQCDLSEFGYTKIN
jgi:hypothetical protein